MNQNNNFMIPESDYEPRLVSVIIPTYNRAHFILETLDSVFAQTYRPIEVIIVDDGSTDDTDIVVRSWKETMMDDKDFDVKYFVQTNGGPSAARNYGLHESKGEYIQFLDSDDLLSRDKISYQVKVLNDEPDFEAAYCRWRTLFDRAIIKYSPYYQTNAAASEDDMLRGYISDTWFLPPHAYIFDRKAIINNGLWDQKIIFQDDTDFLIRLLLNKVKFLFVAHGHVDYRRHLSPHVSASASWASGIKVKEKAYLALKGHGIAEGYTNEFITWYQTYLNTATLKGYRGNLTEFNEDFQSFIAGLSIRPDSNFINKVIYRISSWSTIRMVRHKIGDCFLAWMSYLVNLIK